MPPHSGAIYYCHLRSTPGAGAPDAHLHRSFGRRTMRTAARRSWRETSRDCADSGRSDYGQLSITSRPRRTPAQRGARALRKKNETSSAIMLGWQLGRELDCVPEGIQAGSGMAYRRLTIPGRALRTPASAADAVILALLLRLLLLLVRGNGESNASPRLRFSR